MDVEKVIKGVECHRKKVQTTNAVSCLECPYSEPNPIREWCIRGLMNDIYALLEKQEAVELIDIIDEKYPVGDSNRYKGYRCGKCKEVIPWDANYCLYCGRKVKWEQCIK